MVIVIKANFILVQYYNRHLVSYHEICLIKTRRGEKMWVEGRRGLKGGSNVCGGFGGGGGGLDKIENPGRGLVVNFRKKSGEMRWKKIIFTAYFLHLFAVNAVNRGELFFFTAFSVFLQKRVVPTRVRTSDLLHAFQCLFHCANCHLRVC